MLATQHHFFEETETALSSDLASLGTYFRKWRLRPNLNETETTCFHLFNNAASRQHQVHFEDVLLRHNTHPKYLGVTLDMTLAYKRHLENTAAKLLTRNNNLHRLCGTTWGSTAEKLRTSALGLAYSTAEYGAPIWLNSTHTQKVDTMRIISRTLKSTPTEWLPILRHISAPDLWSEAGLLREYKRIQGNPQLPIHQDIDKSCRNRLRSRRLTIRTSRELHTSQFNPKDSWERKGTDDCSPC